MSRISTSLTNKKGRKRVFGLFCLLIFGSATFSHGIDPYEISWYTIDSGGGTSSGGPYVLTGTIGQPDAEWSKGDVYEVLGGFWPGGPLCIVEFEDFAKLAELWLESGSDLPGDLDSDGDVDSDDLNQFAEWWLCYCPVGWSLR